VQGVAWNPVHPMLATLSSDRALRVYSAATRKLTAKVHKANLAVDTIRPPPRRKKTAAAASQPEAAAVEGAAQSEAAGSGDPTEEGAADNRDGLPRNFSNIVYKCRSVKSG